MRPGRQGGWRAWLPVAGVFILSCVWFGWRLPAEPYFIDEGAYLAQTYYFRLIHEGQLDDIDWLHHASYDHLQLGRLIMGASLYTAGHELPDSIQMMDRWYGDEVTPSDRSLQMPREALLTGRWVMMAGAAWGCAMMYVVGRQLVGPLTGMAAAALLAASPLYTLHARRAMVDDLMQALALTGVAAFLPSITSIRRGEWKRYVGCTLVAGVALGLAASAKLNGAIALLAVLMTAGLGGAVVLWHASRRIGVAARIATHAVLVGALANGIFVGIHPYFTAQPTLPSRAETQASEAVLIDGHYRSSQWIDERIRPLSEAGVFERVRHMIAYRQRVLSEMLEKNQFPGVTLHTVPARMLATLRALGKYSTMGLVTQDALLGGTIVLALAGLGVWWCFREGFHQTSRGELPTVWVFLIWPALEAAALLINLTLDWDRYYLGIVVLASLLTAVGIGGTLQRISRRMVLEPPLEGAPPTSLSHA